MDAEPERRRGRRVPARLEVAYEDAERQVFLMSTNLSEDGAFLLAPDPPTPGVPARLVFELPGHPAILRLSAVVARRQASPQPGFAVRFDAPSLPQPTLDALRSYVNRVARAAPEPT